MKEVYDSAHPRAAISTVPQNIPHPATQQTPFPATKAG
jgi:hypothetical protein